MKKLTSIIVALCCMLICNTDILAQKKGDSSGDYNIKKAKEVLEEEHDMEKALKLVNDQLDKTPDNVDALQLRIHLSMAKGNYGLALSDISHIMKVNKPKKSGFCKSSAYAWRAKIYEEMGDKEKAVEDYRTALNLARKDDRENVPNIAFDYGVILSELKRYDESNAAFQQMLKENEADQDAMVGLARNLMDQDRCQEAVDILNKAEKFNEEYAQVYRIRLLVYDKMGEKDKAIDDCIKFCEKVQDKNTYTGLAVYLMKKHLNYGVSKIKAALKKSEDEVFWYFVLSQLYVETGEWKLAIREFDRLEKEYGKIHWLYAERASCYGKLGIVDRAIDDMTKAIVMQPCFDYYCQRGDLYHHAARYDEAIADYTSAIEERPDNAYGYYGRGWCYELMGDPERAMAEYNYGIDIDKNIPYLYLMRGELLLLRGEKEKADEDFEQVLQRDTVAKDGSCRQYALHFLGRDDEAMEWMQKIIDKEPSDAGHYYDKTCLLCRMGRLDEAVEAFRKCLDVGCRSFGHIEHDDDLDPIRELPGFKEALDEAKKRCLEMQKEFETELPESESKIIEVSMKRNSGGTFEVPCEINGLPLQMLFDTGASDVTISSVEANFMLKNNYLSERDIRGKRYYQIADGQLTEGTVITLHNVKIGEAVLRNVDASVVKSQKAPLLFGQSAMERFGTITIDNIGNKLIIRQ